MTKEQLLKRLAEFEKAINESAAHHNTLVGGMTELKHWLALYDNPVISISSSDEDVRNCM